MSDLIKSEPPKMGLEPLEYIQAASTMTDYILHYYDKLKSLKPIPDVKSGFMREILDSEVPAKIESWQTVFKDLDDVILKGMTHWQSPGFFAYYCLSTSYPSILGDMLSNAVACSGFSWKSSPSCTELETVVLDWVAKALNLPEAFLHNGTGPGCGVIQGSACEATLVTLLAARNRAIRNELVKNPGRNVHEIVGNLVAYTSVCAHSSLDRAGLIALVDLRKLDVDSNASLRGSTLKKAIEKDRENGKIPFYVCATSGTTACCSFDNIEEIGEICEQENIWLHVDAAYAGAALICPEYRYICKGLETVTSFCCNAHKWMMVNFDCSLLWVKNSKYLDHFHEIGAKNSEHESHSSVIDYGDWIIPGERRFRSIKLWFVLRMVGVEGLRHHVRKGVSEAKYLEKLVAGDSRFEVLYPVHLGLVCFRLKKPGANLKELNALNEEFCSKVTRDKRVYLLSSAVNGLYFIRVRTGVVTSSLERIDDCWAVIQEIADGFCGYVNENHMERNSSKTRQELNTVFTSKLPSMGLEPEDFRSASKAMVSYIANYYEKLGTLEPTPNVKPGFMREILSDSMPEECENWQAVFRDLDEVIMKGTTHWQSPGFCAYFPSNSSYPSFLGDMLNEAVSCVGFSWISGPSCTELETVVLDWVAKALDLPEVFLYNGTGPGGAVIQGSACDATLVTMLAARRRAIMKEQQNHPNKSNQEVASRLVAYTSELCTWHVGRSSNIALVELRKLDVDSNASLRGSTLKKAIEEDREKGKIPFYVCATLGTTACCSFDNIEEIGDICEQENIWLHVDAAYAGAALICPEYRYICKGLEMADSFALNADAGMMVSFDCTPLWLTNSSDLINSLMINPVYLKHGEMIECGINYRHWQIPLSRRFRSIKLWFVLRMVGVEGLRHHVRKGVSEAKYLEKLVAGDSRFEMLYPVHLGLVSFRYVKLGASLKELNDINVKLCKRIIEDKRLLITPAEVKGICYIRFVCGNLQAGKKRIENCWNIIEENTDLLLLKY